MEDSSKNFLHQLGDLELRALAQGWQEATAAMLEVMTRIGREPAYNVLLHNGPGAGIYLEFLPYTQETGGYEHHGLFICQATPVDDASTLRDMISI